MIPLGSSMNKTNHRPLLDSARSQAKGERQLTFQSNPETPQNNGFASPKDNFENIVEFQFNQKGHRNEVRQEKNKGKHPIMFALNDEPDHAKPMGQSTAGGLGDFGIGEAAGEDDAANANDAGNVMITHEDLNLKYGDIIYFKFYKELSKGVISGDGIAGNKLECISMGQIIESGSEEYENFIRSTKSRDSLGGADGLEEQNEDEEEEESLKFSNRSVLCKKASLQFRKSLFRVVTSKKYFYTNQYNEENKLLQSQQGRARSKASLKKLFDIEAKMKEENEENENALEAKLGTNVIYGEEIQLEHIYSKCTVTLNPEVLAYEHCCRELSLEEQASQWSNFIVNSANNAKKIGEPVMYKETLLFFNSQNPQYWINVSAGGDNLNSEMNQTQKNPDSNNNENKQQGEQEDEEEAVTDLFDNGVEVNCTDRSAPLKLCSYMTVNDIRERSDDWLNFYEHIAPGEIVYFFNRLVKGRFGVRRKVGKKEESQFVVKNYRMELDTPSQLDDSISEIVARQGLTVTMLRTDDYTHNGQEQYEFFVDTSSEEGLIETLWEVQRVKNFKSRLLRFGESIRLKNVWTGLYVYLSYEDELQLSLEGNLDKAFFQLKPKKVVQVSDPLLHYNVPFRVCQNLSDRTVVYVRCKETIDDDEDDGDEDDRLRGLKGSFAGRTATGKSPQQLVAISSMFIKKDQRNQLEYEMMSVDPKLKLLADRVSSLFPYLMDFYVFLMRWGIRIEHSAQLFSSSTELWVYDYQEAFNSQKQLCIYVQQLEESIENLEDFLHEDEKIKERQNILLNAGILEIIMHILKLIHSKIFFHCEVDAMSRDPENISTDVKAIPDKTPMKIAAAKLHKSIAPLYKLIESCLKGNSECASFVLRNSQDNFLFDQIRFHKYQVISLLKEATRYVDGDQKELNIKNMDKWIKKIQQVSLMNIQEQTFIIELLSLSITDHLEQPIPDYQDQCRKLLFRRPKKPNMEGYPPPIPDYDNIKNDSQYSGYLRKPMLLSFKLVNDVPMIIFNLDPHVSSNFSTQNPDLVRAGVRSFNVYEKSKPNHFSLSDVNGALLSSLGATRDQINLERYEGYVLEVLNLYALLSAGRNSKSIDCLQSLGLTKIFVERCLQSKSLDAIHLRQYRSILNLYNSYILNVPPFVSISNYNNMCFLSEDFDRFKPKSHPSYELFHEIIVDASTRQQIRKEFQSISTRLQQVQANVSEQQLLLEFARVHVQKERQDYDQLEQIKAADARGEQIDSKSDLLKVECISSLKIQDEFVISASNKKYLFPSRLDHTLPAYANEKIDKQKLSQYMMEMFHQMLKIIKTRIDLGYNTATMNDDIMKIIPNLFLGLIDWKEERISTTEIDMRSNARRRREKGKTLSMNQYNQNWVYYFMRHNLPLCGEHLVTTKIFIEAIQIVDIIEKLNMYFFIVEKIQEIRTKNKNLNQVVDGSKALAQSIAQQQELAFSSNEYFESFRFKASAVDASAKQKEKSGAEETPSSELSVPVLIMQTLEYLREDATLEAAMLKTLQTRFDYLKVLQASISNVEIIEEEIELKLYREINGISDNDKFRSPMDIQLLVQKTGYYFKYTQELYDQGFFDPKLALEELSPEEITARTEAQDKLNELNVNYDGLLSAVLQINQLYKQTLVNESRPGEGNHLLQLQNILRHSKIPMYLENILNNVPMFTSEFNDLYWALVEFYELLIKDNPTNIALIQEMVPKFLQLCLIPSDLPIFHEHTSTKAKKASNSEDYLPTIKISRLCISLMESSKEDQQVMKQMIQKIIDLIEENMPFKVSKSQKHSKQSKYKIYRCAVDEYKAMAIVQYIKILKSFTIGKWGISIPMNQLQILNNFMHKPFLSDLIQPILETYLTKFNITFEQQNDYLKLVLHCQAIHLLSYCCKDNKIGIQEMQRFMMFDTLKAIVVSSKSPFILKRAYLKCLFESYVNKVYELEKEGCNETISNEELNDILRHEIVQVLRISLSYRYLEGLVRPKKEGQSKLPQFRNTTRESVKKSKYLYFRNMQAYKQVVWFDEHETGDETKVSMKYPNALRDASEYWKYLFKDGVIHFLVDTYDEIMDLISISSADRIVSLVGSLKIIGYYLQELLLQLNAVEKELKVDLSLSHVKMNVLQLFLEVVPIGAPKSVVRNMSSMSDFESKVKLDDGDGDEEIQIMRELLAGEELPEQIDLQQKRQFKLQMLRKRLSVEDFIMLYFEKLNECSFQMNRALFAALNHQKICYTPSQVNYLLRKQFGVQQVSGAAQNGLGSDIMSPRAKMGSGSTPSNNNNNNNNNNNKKGGNLSSMKSRTNINFNMSFGSALSQHSSLIRQIIILGSPKVLGEISMEIMKQMQQEHMLKASMQGQVENVNLFFGKQMKTSIKDALNILKKSIIDPEVSIRMSGKNARVAAKQYSEDADNGIADYDLVYDEEDDSSRRDILPEMAGAARGSSTESNGARQMSAVHQMHPMHMLNEQTNLLNLNSAAAGAATSATNPHSINGLDSLSGGLNAVEEMTLVETAFTERLMIDSQIAMFIRDVQQTFDIFEIDSETLEELGEQEAEYSYYSAKEETLNKSKQVFSQFIDQVKSVFSSNKIILVKTIRMLLEIVQVNDHTMEDLTSTSNSQREKAVKKFELLQQCQNAVAESGAFRYAIELIRVDSTYDEIQEGLIFMICMLNRGNPVVQKEIYYFFQHNTEDLTTFIAFLRRFFNQEIGAQIKRMSDEKDITDIPTEFQILSMKILKLIQLFCENVNADFQKFLMNQKVGDFVSFTSYNITLEISTFLSIFLEDDILLIDEKQQIILQCLQTLNEIISGQPEALECISQNKRLFSYLNEKIFQKLELNIRPPKKREGTREEAQISRDTRNTTELFQSALKLILTIVSGLPNPDRIQFIFDSLNSKRLIGLAKQIYVQRIEPKKEMILIDEECNHPYVAQNAKKQVCDDDFCCFGKVTPIDKLFMSTGFNIFILYYYLRELFPDNKEKLLPFFIDEKAELASSFDQLLDSISKLTTSTKRKTEPEKKSDLPLSIGLRSQRTISKRGKSQIIDEANNRNKNNDEEEMLDIYGENEQAGDFTAKPNALMQSSKKIVAPERMSARILLHRGMGGIILNDINALDKTDPAVAAKETRISQAAIATSGIYHDITGLLQQFNFDDMFGNSRALEKTQPFFRFYQNFVASTEVVTQTGDLTRIYFQKPFYTKFLTGYIKKHLIYQSDRDSDAERMQFLLCHIQFYEEQMIHKQRISKWGIFSYFADKWPLYKLISYYLVIALTIMTLATFGQNLSESVDASELSVEGSLSDDVQLVYQIISIVQLVLSFSILVSCAIERYPISINRNVSTMSFEMIRAAKTNAGFPDDDWMSFYNRAELWLMQKFSPESAKNNPLAAICLIIFDQENLYNLAYLLITALAYENNLIYSFLLLDIVKRSEDLRNVISSITKNSMNLIKFSFLGIIIMYIYGIIGSQNYKSEYSADDGGISDTFILTITTTIKEGLRKGGGIADSMSNIEYNAEDFWGRYFYDLTFFIVINMLFIQIIFGIILDTFGELRDNRQELLKMVHDSCYVCGLERRTVEAYSESDWYHHIYMDHNCYNLLFFLIYLRRKSENDCDALEKHIKRILESKDQKSQSFIPIGSSIAIKKYKGMKQDGDKKEDSKEESK